jgi:hypothetical protein
LELLLPFAGDKVAPRKGDFIDPSIMAIGQAFPPLITRNGPAGRTVGLGASLLKDEPQNVHAIEDAPVPSMTMTFWPFVAFDLRRN